MSISPPSSISLSLLGGQHLLQLRGVCPVWEECASSAMTANLLPFKPVGLADRLQRVREGLHRHHDDQLAGQQRVASRPDFDSPPALRTSSALMVATMPSGAVDLPDRVLQLRVEHGAVGDHDDGVEDLRVVRVVQRGQPVRGPGDRVGLARPGRVLDQVPLPGPSS